MIYKGSIRFRLLSIQDDKIKSDTVWVSRRGKKRWWELWQIKKCTGGGFMTLCALTSPSPPPPPSPLSSSSSLWIDAGIPDAIFRLLVVESRAWVEERKRRGERGGRGAAGKWEGVRDGRGGGGEKKEGKEERRGCGLGGGGGFPCGLELQQHQHKAPRCEGFESWPDSQEKQKRERRVISLHIGRYCFLWFSMILFLTPV